MAVIFIEGFEQIAPSVGALSAEQLEYLFLALEPDYVTGWYDGPDDEVIHETSGRISGNCLKFARGAAMEGSWGYNFAGMLGFAFNPKQRMTCGWAMKFSQSPETSIPLCVFRYDNGSMKEEQCSLWATPDGKLFLSSTNFNADYTTQSDPIAIPQSMTPEGTFRFAQWTYIEMMVNYSGTVPTFTLVVNGEIIMNAVAHAAFRKMTGDDNKYVSSVHLINPTVGHFGMAGFDHFLDDMYFDDSAIRGPQWVIKMGAGATLANTGGMGSPSDEYDGILFTQPDNHYDYVRYELDNLPANVGVVTAIGINTIAWCDVGLDGFTMSFRNHAGTSSSGTKRGTVSQGAPPRCFRTVDQAPGGMAMTGVGLNGLAVQIASSPVYE